LPFCYYSFKYRKEYAAYLRKFGFYKESENMLKSVLEDEL